MEYQWAKSRIYGDQATYVKGLAGQGIGYIILDEGKDQRGNYVNVAFKRPNDGILPQHLELCNEYEVDKFEKISERRTNNNGKQGLTKVSSSMFPSK